MRLFIAIQLSDPLKTAITDTMHQLKQQGVKGSYVPKQNLHLTLSFLGNVRDVAAVKEALQSVTVKGFRLTLSGLGSFGDLLWVGVKGNQGLSAAAKDVRAALDAAGIAYDQDKFSPHITIIRKAAGNWKQVCAPKGEMTVKGFSIMKSETRDGKTVYTEI